MHDWHFEVIYFHNRRMNIDVQDGMITTAVTYRANKKSQATEEAEQDANDHVLTKQGWFVRVTSCTKLHADKIKKISQGLF